MELFVWDSAMFGPDTRTKRNRVNTSRFIHSLVLRAGVFVGFREHGDVQSGAEERTMASRR